MSSQQAARIKSGAGDDDECVADEVRIGSNGGLDARARSTEPK